jgi:hypothetical protein
MRAAVAMAAAATAADETVDITVATGLTSITTADLAT